MDCDATLILRREDRHIGGGEVARRTDGALRRQYLLNRPPPNPSPVSGDGTWGIVAHWKLGRLDDSGRKGLTPSIHARHREPAQPVRTGEEFLSTAMFLPYSQSLARYSFPILWGHGVHGA
jgi:hypothetical protein